MPRLAPLYADLAPYYDRFCQDVDYAGQCAFAERVFACFAETDGRACLDLACGTGRHLAQLHARGFAVTGLDNSPAMLAQAAARCPQAEWLCCDLAALPTAPRFDLITCFLYSLHYSHPRQALIETLRRAWQALRPGGVLLFDLVDAAGIGCRDAVSHCQEADAAFTFRSGWRYPGQGERLELQISIERRAADGVQHWQDRHTMTAIGIAEVSAALSGLGFAVTVLERDFERLAPWDGASFNVLMVAAKPASRFAAPATAGPFIDKP